MVTAIYYLDFTHGPYVLQPLPLWLQNIRTMDKVQIIDRSNTASKKKSKVKLSRYTPCRHMGGEEV
jgi:hypothetical protein